MTDGKLPRDLALSNLLVKDNLTVNKRLTATEVNAVSLNGVKIPSLFVFATSDPVPSSTTLVSSSQTLAGGTSGEVKLTTPNVVIIRAWGGGAQGGSDPLAGINPYGGGGSGGYVEGTLNDVVSINYSVAASVQETDNQKKSIDGLNTTAAMVCKNSLNYKLEAGGGKTNPVDDAYAVGGVGGLATSDIPNAIAFNGNSGYAGIYTGVSGYFRSGAGGSAPSGGGLGGEPFNLPGQTFELPFNNGVSPGGGGSGAIGSRIGSAGAGGLILLTILNY